MRNLPTAFRIQLTAKRNEGTAHRNLNTALRLQPTAKRILATAQRNLNTALRILATALRIQATAQHLTMNRQKTHLGILFTSTLGRGETPTIPAQRACTSSIKISNPTH